MQEGNSLDLAEARIVGEAALKAVSEAGGAPVSVAVADSARAGPKLLMNSKNPGSYSPFLRL